MKTNAELAAADARLDQESMALQDLCCDDVHAWGQFLRRLRDPKCGRFSLKEMDLILRLANYGGQIVTAKVLERSV